MLFTIYKYKNYPGNVPPCPARKREVGERLACLALHRDYGFSRLACDSPEAVRAGLLPLVPFELTVE